MTFLAENFQVTVWQEAEVSFLDTRWKLVREQLSLLGSAEETMDFGSNICEVTCADGPPIMPDFVQGKSQHTVEHMNATYLGPCSTTHLVDCLLSAAECCALSNSQ